MANDPNDDDYAKPSTFDDETLNKRAGEAWDDLEEGHIDKDEYEEKIGELESEQENINKNAPPDWADAADEGRDNWGSQIADKD